MTRCFLPSRKHTNLKISVFSYNIIIKAIIISNNMMIILLLILMLKSKRINITHFPFLKQKAENNANLLVPSTYLLDVNTKNHAK